MAEAREPEWALTAHPAHAPYACWLRDAPRDGLPSLRQFNVWARQARLGLPDGRLLRFERSAPGIAALEFERRVAVDGVIGMREGSAHDAWNALAWLAFPHTKAALNAVHVREGAAPAANARSPARDAATLLDESGLLIACDESELITLLRRHAWRELFVERRERVRVAMHAFAVGHGLLDRLARPYRALTAKALVVTGTGGRADVDVRAATVIAGPDFGPGALTPLPVAALPGWDSENLGASLFDDASVFRPPRATLADKKRVRT